ncbi:hypothetical protein FQN54_004298 [Arachnomyces sp. PD_36]|nr:hypothetical protein FQN54_004298 [Arachnomyces sp. PD_36]
MASNEPASPSVDGSLPDAPAATAPKQTYKSFKKKYAKMRIKFDEEMKESNALCMESLKINELSKKMKEQHDQLLDLLLDFNDSLHLPPHLRYDLNVPSPSDPLQEPEPKAPTVSHNPASARAALHKAKARLTAREISPDEYRTVEDEVRESKVFAPGVQFSSLLEIPHTEPGDDLSTIGEMETSLGFLNPDEEAEYLNALDFRLGDSADTTLPKSNAPPAVDKEKEVTLQNPVSFYNWLRKHKPHVVVQDNEPNAENPPSRPSNARASKRSAAQMRKEEDMYDEDGILLDLDNGPGASTSRGKRKRDEDGGYRPKGGSSRPSKRRKEKDDAAYSGKCAK